MMKSRWWLNRVSVFIGLALLWTAGTMLVPDHAGARPYDPTTILDNYPVTGDPTGDDRPSPTPKPTSLRASSIGGGSSVTAGGVSVQRLGATGALARWVTFLKLSFRLVLR
jgi:hypothetical protein